MKHLEAMHIVNIHDKTKALFLLINNITVLFQNEAEYY